ncbi:5-formyltetrahydrofolate cyclo-ligase [Actinokineospora sp. NBRC 105648]|uniref:5-formyltetrahydrofolate cyclo-ligase n=1 Tax=Actinokineospora sp. NBRC 105648 TaxID=3032206 RepID=UPI00249FE5E6|nr:5-formyltetrahydrofolate cyclo-ligase [Actinokineospora sp. NBRC 105648]GLZ41772.1 5-formyltetrahydrofolate cyclo-ligase [Actinokineospora sp. NBRC 105648]
MAGPGSDLDATRAWTKDQWRRALLAERRRVPASVRFDEAMQLTALLTSGRVVSRGQTLCAYVPIGSEPGSVQMLDEVAEHGVRILLPIVAGAGPLDWAWYDGHEFLRPGPYGLRQPIGERLGEAALRIADVVLVPALAVDRHGTRLGRGAGYYDRSLSLAAPDTPLIAVVRDPELFDVLPAEPHDVRMSGVLTPTRGLLRLR